MDNEIKEEVLVGDLLDEVQHDIDLLQVDISRRFEEKRNSVLSMDKSAKEYFISKNPLWDMWFQKLFAQLISVKIWVMLLITILLSKSLITSIEFASLFGIIMGFKGAFSVAEVWTTSASDIQSKNILKRV